MSSDSAAPATQSLSVYQQALPLGSGGAVSHVDEPMAGVPKGGELFIVDNSDDYWKGIRYLQDWTEIASAFDIATGYFEIGALLALDGKWQKLDKIRILMGDEVSRRTRQALLDGLRARILTELDASAEDVKEGNDFLAGAPAIVGAMASRKIECRVYAKPHFPSSV